MNHMKNASTTHAQFAFWSSFHELVDAAADHPDEEPDADRGADEHQRLAARAPGGSRRAPEPRRRPSRPPPTAARRTSSSRPSRRGAPRAAPTTAGCTARCPRAAWMPSTVAAASMARSLPTICAVVNSSVATSPPRRWGGAADDAARSPTKVIEPSSEHDDVLGVEVAVREPGVLELVDRGPDPDAAARRQRRRQGGRRAAFRRRSASRAPRRPDRLDRPRRGRGRRRLPASARKSR